MSFPILGSPKPTPLYLGAIVSGGWLYSYDPATDALKATYPTADDADAATNANANPVQLGDLSGTTTNGYYGIDNEKYKIVCKTSGGTTVWTEDDIRLPTALPTLYGNTAQTLTDAGAVTLTESTTFIVTTTDSALTLADGAENQEKFIVMKTESGVAKLTPASFANGTSIFFDRVGATAHLIFMNASWHWAGGTASLFGGSDHNNMFPAGLHDPTKWVVYFNDFNTFTTTDWVITTIGSAGETILQGAGINGALQIINDDADNDSDFLQFSGTNASSNVSEQWKFTTGKKLIFKCRVTMVDADQTSMHIGLGITDTTPGQGGSGFSDAVVFNVNDTTADGVCFARVIKNSVQTLSGVLTTMVDSTYVDLMFIKDENEVLSFYVNDAFVETVATTTLPDDENLTISFGVQNGEAAANDLKIDYIFVAQER